MYVFLSSLISSFRDSFISQPFSSTSIYIVHWYSTTRKATRCNQACFLGRLGRGRGGERGGGGGGEEREGRGVSGSILPPFLPLPRNLIRTRFITREMQELRGLDKECCLGLCSGLEIWLLLLSLLFVPFVVVSRMLRWFLFSSSVFCLLLFFYVAVCGPFCFC